MMSISPRLSTGTRSGMGSGQTGLARLDVGRYGRLSRPFQARTTHSAQRTCAFRQGHADEAAVLGDDEDVVCVRLAVEHLHLPARHDQARPPGLRERG